MTIQAETEQAVLSLVALIGARPPLSSGLWYFAVDATVAAVYGTVSGVILSRRQHVVPWLVALMAIGCGLSAFGCAYGELSQRRSTFPAIGWIIGLQNTAWIPGTLASFLVLPWLVREHRLGAAGRLGGLLGILTAATLFLIQVTGDGGIGQQGLPILAGICVVLGLVAAASVAWRWRNGPPPERRGLGWLALGTAAMSLSFLPLAIPADVLALPIWFTPSIHLTVQTVFPAAVFVSVLRQRLWGLDLAISRGTLAGLLTAAVVIVYVVVTSIVRRLVPGSGSAQTIAAIAVVLAVQPSRSWLQQRVQHLVYGPDAEPSHAVRRLGRQLGGAGDPQQLLTGLVETVGAALRLESVVLGSGSVTLARWGIPTSTPLELPLDLPGNVTPCVLQVTTPPGEALDARGRRILQELATVVTAGVVLARATLDLDEARAKLTSARLEERRVIRRELHDGLGPSLAGIRLGLRGARNLIEKDPASAAELLASLQDELDQRVDDVRSLSHSLLPPALDELGLGPALAELAARQREAGLALDVSCTGAAGLPSELAAAAYGIIVEAVTNVARHSGADAARITVVVDAEALTLTVDDNGHGIPDDAVPGVGSQSMRERALEQQGELEVCGLEPSGTRIWARLPLGRTLTIGLGPVDVASSGSQVVA